MEENQKKSSGKATASLILGIISLVAWLLPLIGYPVSIVGLCLGISNVKKEKDTFSKVGIILSAIGLGITASTTSSKSEKINVTATPKKESKTTKESTNVTQEIDAFAAISLILGFASMITWLYPLLGVAVAIPGLSIGIVTHETKRSNYSLIGIVMSLVGIILSIIKAFSA